MRILTMAALSVVVMLVVLATTKPAQAHQSETHPLAYAISKAVVKNVYPPKEKAIYEDLKGNKTAQKVFRHAADDACPRGYDFTDNFRCMFYED